MTHRLFDHLDGEDQDTVKLGLWGALTGLFVSPARMAANGAATVVTHRSGLNAAQDEWDKIYGEG